MVKKENVQPVFRVLQPIVLSTNRQMYMPGALVDLSHLPPASRQYYLDRKIVETADGIPENDPAVPVQPCKNC